MQPYTSDEILLSLYTEDRKSVTEISRLISRDRKSIYKRLKRLGAPLRGGLCKPCEDRPDIFTGKDPVGNYWAGFLMADGCIQPAGKLTTLSLGLSIKDKEHVEKFKRYVGCANKISTGITYALLQFQCRGIVEKLISLGVTREKTKTVGALSLAGDRDFWRGVIDGDGTLCNHKTTSYYKGKVYNYSKPSLQLVGSYDLLTQWLTFVKAHTFTKANVIAHKSIWKVAIHGQAALDMMSILYSEACEALDRKRSKADAFLHL